MAHHRQTNGCILRITPGRVNLPVVEDIVNEKFLETSIFGTQYRQMLEPGEKICEDWHVFAKGDLQMA